MHEETGDLIKARSAVEQYLESGGQERSYAWERIAEQSRRLREHARELQAWVEYARSDDFDVEQVSRAANRVNALLRAGEVDPAEKRDAVDRLIQVFSANIRNASGDDCSRLAWLHMHMGHSQKALEVTLFGLEREPDNTHLRKLRERLESQRSLSKYPAPD